MHQKWREIKEGEGNWE
jgi:hypothetical protein